MKDNITESSIDVILEEVKEKISNHSIEPIDYCKKYLGYQLPNSTVKRADCIRALVKATWNEYTFDTIDRNWGANFEKCPERAIKLIAIAATLADIELELRKNGMSVRSLLNNLK